MSELNEKLATAWEGFTKGDWQNEVNVRDFIQKNYRSDHHPVGQSNGRR